MDTLKMEIDLIVFLPLLVCNRSPPHNNHDPSSDKPTKVDTYDGARKVFFQQQKLSGCHLQAAELML